LAAAASAGPSPIRAAQLAVDHARSQLFPFRFERWLALGFVAFLDQCGRGGGASGFRAGEKRAWPGAGQAADWLAAHAALVTAAAAAVFLLLLGIYALASWLQSRGTFVYIDDVATGRAEVARPWREHASLADSYFVWRFGLSAGTLVLVFGLLGLGAVAFVRLARSEALPLAILAIGGPLVLAFLLVALVSALASVALRDLAAPVQFRHRCPCGEALRETLRLAREHPSVLLVYVLLKAVFAVGLTVAVLLACCLTCCLGLLPVVMQTVLQPAFYFERAWSLFLLQELGHDVFAPPPPPEFHGHDAPTEPEATG
jgi:hypothetical protein